MSTFPVFVYGTLREGGALESMLSGTGSRRRALAHGYTLFEYAGGAYPVMMQTPGRELPVLGDLIEIDVDDMDAQQRLIEVSQMEVASGYTPAIIQCRSIDDHARHQAIGFLWLDHDDDAIGREVPSGDWLTHRMLIDAEVQAERDEIERWWAES